MEKKTVIDRSDKGRTHFWVRLFFLGFLYSFGLLLLFETLYLLYHLPDQQEINRRSFAVDTYLGWKHAGNYHFTDTATDLGGNTYPVVFSSTYNGFKSYPSIKQDSVSRMLIIGDSFTQAIEVSNDKTYYQHIADSLGLAMYAYGMAGYNTLQEYLILDQYIDSIQPQVVLLQFTSNDFIENDLELTRKSMYLFGGRRPYLDKKGDLYYSYPITTLDLMLSRTYFLKYFGRKLDEYGTYDVPIEESGQRWIGERGKAYPPYKQSIETTERIMEMIQSRLASKAKLLLLCADQFEPQQSDILAICANMGIQAIPFPQHKMIPGGSKHLTYSQDSWHWNELGHKIIGEEVIRTLRESRHLFFEK